MRGRVLLGAALWPCLALAAPGDLRGDLTISAPALGSTIELRTSARFAGAVSSLMFRGREYVDVQDHGRELQSASSFDGLGECFNPTEAGSIADPQPTSSSRLLAIHAGANWIETQLEMAFWLPPGSDYGQRCGQVDGVTHAMNRTVRGGHLLQQRLTIGVAAAPNVITDQVTYTVPEAHAEATFEAATLYTPPSFSRHYLLNPATGALLTATQDGEQPFPVILATANGSDAVGLWSPGLPQNGYGYGTFSFPATSKINCVYRVHGIQAGQHFSYVCAFAVGTLEEVRRTLLALTARR